MHAGECARLVGQVHQSEAGDHGVGCLGLNVEVFGLGLSGLQVVIPAAAGST